MNLENKRQVLGIIGGSGVYDIDGLVNKRWQKVNSPFGAPSDEFLMGELAGQEMVFLPRHGRGHPIVTDERGRAVRERQEFLQIVRAEAAVLRIHGIARQAAAAYVNFIFFKQHERRIGKRIDLFDVVGGMRCGGRFDRPGEKLKNHGDVLWLGCSYKGEFKQVKNKT